MNEDRNCQWRVARRPDGNVDAGDFEYTEAAVPEPEKGEFLVRILYLNLAPVMRMYMSGQSAAGEKPLAIGDVIHGRGVAEVIASNHPDYEPGEVVQGQFGWQTYAVSSGASQQKIRKVPDLGVPYTVALSTLGMTGFSAYFGFVDHGRPKPGDVVVVSGAAGGVGTHVVQIAKIFDCEVIGIAGGTQKCELITALGCDRTIDYKSADVTAEIAAACPNGMNIYFDNVGGETLAACLENLAYEARIVLCGSISEYMLDEPFGLTNYTRLRRTNSSMHGFFIYNHAGEFDRAERDLGQWLAEGKIRPVEHVFDGFDKMPEALASLYSGKNIGMAVCRVRRGPYDTEGLKH